MQHISVVCGDDCEKATRVCVAYTGHPGAAVRLVAIKPIHDQDTDSQRKTRLDYTQPAIMTGPSHYMPIMHQAEEKEVISPDMHKMILFRSLRVIRLIPSSPSLTSLSSQL